MRYSLNLLIWLVLYTALPGSVLALVNINSATLSELDSLPYVGTSTAESIISGRPFSATSDIQRISGFGGGPGTRNYDAVIGLITVSGSTAVSTVATTDSDSDKSTSIAKDTREVGPGPIPGLTVTIPERAYAGQLLSFEVKPNDGKEGRNVRYKWNFGDGTIDNSRETTHRYARPGTFVVMAESYYLKETKLARREIEILPLALKLETISSEEVRVTNNGSHEIDLGSMVVVGSVTFTFPKHTILLPDQSLVVGVANTGSVVLKDGDGALLASGAAEALPPPRRTATAFGGQTVAKISTSPQATSTEEIEAADLKSEVSEAGVKTSSQVAALPAADIPKEAWPYLALFSVIGLGIFAVYGTKS